jgi:hypothetical protein
METKDFRKLFKNLAKKNGFESDFSGWFKQSEECIFTMQLIRSYFGKYYMIDLKIYVQGTFGNNYVKDKSLLRDVGDFSTRTPKQFDAALDLEQQMENEERIQKLESLFQDFVVPFSEKALTIHGINELIEKRELYLLPAVKEELEKLTSSTISSKK